MGSPYWSDEHDAYANKLLFAADALLLGRSTYEGFSGSWPTRSGDPYADRINAMPKYVASTTLTDPTWNATVLQGDVVAEITKLKQQDGQNILKFGTGPLDRVLVENKLVDEFHFWIFPVFSGSGEHLFENVGIDLTHLELVDSTSFSTGIVVATYAPKA